MFKPSKIADIIVSRKGYVDPWELRVDLDESIIELVLNKLYSNYTGTAVVTNDKIQTPMNLYSIGNWAEFFTIYGSMIPTTVYNFKEAYFLGIIPPVFNNRKSRLTRDNHNMKLPDPDPFITNEMFRNILSQYVNLYGTASCNRNHNRVYDPDVISGYVLPKWIFDYAIDPVWVTRCISSVSNPIIASLWYEYQLRDTNITPDKLYNVSIDYITKTSSACLPSPTRPYYIKPCDPDMFETLYGDIQFMITYIMYLNEYSDISCELKQSPAFQHICRNDKVLMNTLLDKAHENVNVLGIIPDCLFSGENVKRDIVNGCIVMSKIPLRSWEYISPINETADINAAVNVRLLKDGPIYNMPHNHPVKMSMLSFDSKALLKFLFRDDIEYELYDLFLRYEESVEDAQYFIKLTKVIYDNFLSISDSGKSSIMRVYCKALEYASVFEMDYKIYHMMRPTILKFIHGNVVSAIRKIPEVAKYVRVSSVTIEQVLNEMISNGESVVPLLESVKINCIRKSSLMRILNERSLGFVEFNFNITTDAQLITLDPILQEQSRMPIYLDWIVPELVNSEEYKDFFINEYTCGYAFDLSPEQLERVLNDNDS